MNNQYEDAAWRRELGAPAVIALMRVLKDWWSNRVARRSGICSSRLEEFLHKDSISMHARLAVAKEVLRWAKDLEEEYLSELVEYVDALG